MTKYERLGSAVGDGEVGVMPTDFTPHHVQRVIHKNDPPDLQNSAERSPPETMTAENPIDTHGAVTINLGLSISRAKGALLVSPVGVKKRNPSLARFTGEEAKTLTKAVEFLIEGRSFMVID